MTCKPFPVPEAIAPDKTWRIVPSDRARVSFEDSTMYVPLKSDAGSYVIRCHELAHIAFTPRDGITRANGKCSNESLQACEDYRVNYLAQSHGVDMSDGYGAKWITETCEASKQKLDEKGCVLTLIAYGAINSDLTLSRLTFGSFATSKLRKLASYVRDSLKKNPTFDNTIAMAKYIDDAFYNEGDDAQGKGEPSSDVEPTPSPFQGPAGNYSGEDTNEDETPYEDSFPKACSPTTAVGHKFIIRSEPISLEDLKPTERRWVEDKVENYCEGQDIPATKTKLQYTAENTSGEMRIVTKDLPIVIEKHGARQYVSMKEGCIFYRPHMLTVNGKVFRGVNHHAPAAFLIDCSGSMGLSDEDVEALVRAAPASIVATYCGCQYMPEGELWIVANNGRMKRAPLSAKQGGNVIDVPALTWLSKQRGRKVWVCDGGVTGIGDRPTPVIDVYTTAFTRRHGIVRVEDVAEALELIRKL